MARKIEYFSLISEAARLSTVASRIRRVACDLSRPREQRKFRLVDVSEATVPEHTRKAHKRIVPMSSAYRAKLKARAATPRIEQFLVCDTIRKCTQIPGNVRQKLIAAILRLAKEGPLNAVSRRDGTVFTAFSWAATHPSFPAMSSMGVWEIWSAVDDVMRGIRTWSPSMSARVLKEFRPPKKTGRK